METKELMIGDWVESTIEGQGKVTEISREGQIAITYGNQNNAVMCKTYDLQPIPLTEEILEKNGFKYNEAESVGEWYAYDFPLGKGFFIEKNPMDKTFRITDHRFINVRYVHELQHALRLCKIDKEIEL